MADSPPNNTALSCMEKQWLEVKRLGEGQFGVVYLYKNKVTGDYLVIKKVKFKEGDVGNSRKLIEESKILLQLKHQNIVQMIEVPDELIETNVPALGMEFCPAGDLKKMLKKPENVEGLSQNEVRVLMRDVCDGIEYIHSRSLCHRDIKPDNILLSFSDVRPYKIIFKLCDFGLAKQGKDGSSVCETKVGTLNYMAPEILMSKKYDEKVDYWSFGVVVFECITGKHPFEIPKNGIQSKEELMARLRSHAWTIQTKQSTSVRCHLVKDQYTFYDNLPVGHQLHSTLQMYVEHWLRLVLQHDPTKRGGAVDKDTGRLKCFTYLEQIFKLKFVRFFFPSICEWLSCPVYPGSTSSGMEAKLNSLMAKEKMAKEKQFIRTENYLLLSSSGEIINPMESVEFYAQSFDEDENERIIHVVYLDSSSYQSPRKPPENTFRLDSSDYSMVDVYRRAGRLVWYYHKFSKRIAALVNCQRAMNKWINRLAERIPLNTADLVEAEQSCIIQQTAFETSRTALDQFYSDAFEDKDLKDNNKFRDVAHATNKHKEDCHRDGMTALNKIFEYFRCALDVFAQSSSSGTPPCISRSHEVNQDLQREASLPMANQDMFTWQASTLDGEQTCSDDSMMMFDSS